MSIVRVGSSGTYAAGWDAIFGGRRQAKAGVAKTSKKAKKRPVAGKGAKKAAAKKAKGRRRG